MTGPVRVGAVNYLNVRPLVYGLERHPSIELTFDVPSICARRLAEGSIDLGMIPSIAYLDRPGDLVVPEVCIGSDGPVESVALFSRKPLRDVRYIALDTSSRTSAALVRILCARLFQIDPVFLTTPPDLGAMLERADAALLIGDPALFVDYAAYGANKIDLGSAWKELTGLPFVWAIWSGPPRVETAGIVGALIEAAEKGMAHSDEIAAAYCADRPDRIPIAQRYLRESLHFRLTSRAVDGIRRYFAEAAELGLVGETRDLAFFPARPSSSASLRR